MSAKLQNTPTLSQLFTTSENFQPHDQIQKMWREQFVPKLLVEPKNGHCVNQGDAAISTKTLLTGGLTACTCVILTSDTHNFLCHVDSFTDPKWLADCIKKFIEIGGSHTGVYRFNCREIGLNAEAAKNSRQALEFAGLLESSVDNNSVCLMHTVFAKEPGEKDRVSTFFGRLKID